MSVVGVILSCVDFLAVSVTGCVVVFVRVHIPLVIVASCGEGHWVALNASMTTCWSGRAMGISVESPGISIVLCLILMSGGLVRLVGLWRFSVCVGVLCLGARLLMPAVATPGLCVVVVWVCGISHV